MIVLFGHKKPLEEEHIGKNKQEGKQPTQAAENREKAGKPDEKPLDEKQAKIEELTDLVKRVQAEFENFRKREEKDRKHFIELSNAGLIAELLPVLDSIHAAKKNGKEEVKKGVELIEKQLNSVLGKYGLKEIECIGKKFNPEFHECLMKENNSEKEDNIVSEEFQKGFLLKDRALRHSKVKINLLEKTEIKQEEKENKTEETEKEE
ncbi:MAG: nucleotide exchange factor GrpE [archaeon]